MLGLGAAASWGQVPNNDPSDDKGNTAGGTGALEGISTGVNNTAFGYGALNATQTGGYNTAFGLQALSMNLGYQWPL